MSGSNILNPVHCLDRFSKVQDDRNVVRSDFEIALIFCVASTSWFYASSHLFADKENLTVQFSCKCVQIKNPTTGSAETAESRYLTAKNKMLEAGVAGCCRFKWQKWHQRWRNDLQGSRVVKWTTKARGAGASRSRGQTFTGRLPLKPPVITGDTFNCCASSVADSHTWVTRIWIWA